MKNNNEIEIKLLKFPDCIITRPSMYIGGLENPDVIFREIIDNAIDESYSYFQCNKILIMIKIIMDFT